MFKNIYAVRDTVANSISSGLIMEPLDAPAIRAFYDALSQEGSALNKHPADFDLLLLGCIDIETGDIVTAGTKIIATGSGWLSSQEITK